MPFGVCSIGGERVRGRVASFYWSGWAGDGSRDAWKQRVCKAHYTEESADWLDGARAAFDADGSASCFSCDQAAPAELVEYFCTLFVPGGVAERFTVAACLKHTNDLNKRARAGADPLPDRTDTSMSGGTSTAW
jgi:hypothetical protein